ncbi:MAG: hypothetical protein ACREJ2_13415, partial [Planctomycetota bacterium]
MNRWTVFAAAVLFSAVAGLPLIGADGPTPPQVGTPPAPAAAAALPPWRVASNEVDSGHAYVKLYINQVGILWSDLKRSQLYQSFAQDPAVAASATKYRAKIDAQLKQFNQATKRADTDPYLFNQVAKIGPAAMAFSVGDWQSPMAAAVSIQHDCDPDFAQRLVCEFSGMEAPNLQALVAEFANLPANPVPHRELDGEQIFSLPDGGRAFVAPHHFMLDEGDDTPEFRILQRLKQAAMPPAGEASEQAFVDFMGDESRWLTGCQCDLPLLVHSLEVSGAAQPADFKAMLGAISPVFAREIVNRSNRFDFEASYAGADLNKGIAFFGAGETLNNDVALIFPDELVAAFHVNFDFQKLQALSAGDLVGTSPDLQRSVSAMQLQLSKLTDPKAGGDNAAVKGPKLTRGMSLLVMRPDRIEDIGDSLVSVIGIQPGFQITEEWLKAVGTGQINFMPNPEPPKAKMLSYSNVPIGEVTDGSTTRYIAAIGGALLSGTSGKQVKRVIKYLQQVQSGETDPIKSTAWEQVHALVQQENGGVLYGYSLIKMDFLFDTLIPTGVGAGMLEMPDLPTGVDWAAIGKRLQPAVGIAVYDPNKGIKLRMVSDLPLGSLLPVSMVSLVTLQANMQGFNRGGFGGQEPGTDDLPPVEVPTPDDAPDGGQGGAVMVRPAPQPVAPTPQKQPPPDDDTPKAPAPAPAPGTVPAPAPTPTPAPTPAPAPAPAPA